MNNYTLTKKLEARYSADVVVCGGGTAGAFAAIAAAERGCSSAVSAARRHTVLLPLSCTRIFRLTPSVRTSFRSSMP